MDALSQLETVLELGLGAAALAVALWSAWRSLHARAGAPPTGEIVWCLVAIAVLAGASLAVGIGSGHGV